MTTDTTPLSTIEAPARSRQNPGGRRRLILIAVIVLAALTVAAYFARGQGYRKRLLAMLSLSKPSLPSATFVLTDPADAAIDVPIEGVSITARIRSGRSLDPASLVAGAVHLVRVSDQVAVDIDVSMPDGQSIAVLPKQPLSPRMQYALYVTHDVRTTDGARVRDLLTSFTTAGPLDPDLRFSQQPLPTTEGTAYTCLSMGPDGRLWAGSVDGRVFRFDVRADGTLETPEIFDSLQTAEHGPRLLMGFCFDPAAPAEAPVLIVTHSHFAFENVPDFTGKVSRLSGPRLERVEDLVINLPRSSGDHATNQPVFGPDGAVYFPQASNSATGAPDPFWNNRPEHLLSATVLRLDLKKLPADLPIDVKTADAGGTYDPSAPDAPLTIYASGVRLAYDLLWHSSGRLLVAINGASASGNTLADPSQPGTALKNLATAENDWLIDAQKGGFYGHPNLAAGHYVLNGGRPTTGFTFGYVPEYPIGIRPDPAYRKPILCLGQHISANGMLEYRGPACGGKLDRRVLICRYSRGSDILVLTLDANGNITREDFGLPGLSGFSNPLDLAQHPDSGNLYVSEFGAKRITLVRPL